MSSLEQTDLQIPKLTKTLEDTCSSDNSNVSCKTVEPRSGCPLGLGHGNKTREEDLNYAKYLQLDLLLSCQKPIEAGKATHDQHLFIITHQTFELWFKQVIFELDSIRKYFIMKYLDESNMLTINNRLYRIVLIFKTMVEQFEILETMTALDFMDFRIHLQAASGFQSLQFRIMENKMGLKEKDRVKYNLENYKSVFVLPQEIDEINKSIAEPSLFELLEKWLERTPGILNENFDFWTKYLSCVNQYLEDDFKKPAEDEKNSILKEQKMSNYLAQKDSFSTIANEEYYNYFLKRGERNLSFKAFKGIIFISLYRSIPRFSPAFQMLKLLMDIDNLLIKWRQSHVAMVYRMIGCKLGTGGSSGYQYLRSTTSDRYRPFLDLFNFATFLIPAEYIPTLPKEVHNQINGANSSE